MSSVERRSADWITRPVWLRERLGDLLLVEVDGALGVGRAFHVHADEGAGLLGHLEHGA